MMDSPRSPRSPRSPKPSRALNEAALEHFVYMPVSKAMISYLALKATEVIKCEPPPLGSPNVDVNTTNPSPGAGVIHPNSLPATPPLTPPEATSRSDLPSLEKFIHSLCKRSNVQVPTLMTSLVYLARLKKKLPPVAKGLRCTVHRIFLASLILSAKFLNDSSPKNKHWAEYSNVRGFEPFGFSRTEVNLMEKQLLYLLDWDLNVREDDLYEHFEPFLAPIRAEIERQEEAVRVQTRRRPLSKRSRATDKPQDPEHMILDSSSQYFTPELMPIDPVDVERESVVRRNRPSSSMSTSHHRSQAHPRYESPPALDHVPDLARSETGLSSSGTSSSGSSYGSQASTPQSSVGSYDANDSHSLNEDIYEQYGVGMGTSPSVMMRRDVVKVEMSGANPGAMKKNPALLPYEIETSTTKRGKGTFWKFLGGAQRA